MLVLSRKAGERILIGPDITVTVLRIGPTSVRIGINAPPDRKIVREELTLLQAEPQHSSHVGEVIDCEV